MNFPGFSGNEALKERLTAAMCAGGLSHAYIIYGENEDERKSLGKILASAMVCSLGEGDKPCALCRDCKKALRAIHPDIKTVLREKDKRYYGIDIIRDMARDASTLPNEAQKKVYIIPDGDFLTPPCQNAALRILEDPPPYAAFIILAENPGSFLETFRSRCIELFLSADTRGDNKVSALTGDIINAFKKADPLLIVSAALRYEKCERPDLIAALTELREAFANELRNDASGKRYLTAAELAGRLLDMANANVAAGSIAGMLAVGCNTILK